MKSEVKKAKADTRKKKECEWRVLFYCGTADAIENKVIRLSSYTRSSPKRRCKVKVAGVPRDWNGVDEVIKATVFENAEYNSGFVSVDGGKSWYLAGNFFFHRVRRGRTR